MLEDFHFDDVAVRAAVGGPDLLLRESHAIQHLPGLAVEAVGELFRIGESPADALDHAGFATDVIRRAPVPRWKPALDEHAIADVVAMSRRGRVGRRMGRRGRNESPAHCRLAPFLMGDSISSGTSKRARISAILALSSCSGMYPF